MTAAMTVVTVARGAATDDRVEKQQRKAVSQQSMNVLVAACPDLDAVPTDFDAVVEGVQEEHKPTAESSNDREREGFLDVSDLR